MKKLLKIFGYTVVSILLLLIILFVTASLSQKKIVDIALKKISESTTVPVEIDDLSFTLIKRFPFATVELSGVKIGASGTTQSKNITAPNEDILNIKNVYVSVKTVPLFRGEFEVIKIEIDEALLNYKIDSLGNSNIDFLMELIETGENATLADSSQMIQKSMPTLDLKKVKLKNTSVYFVNDSVKMAATLFFPSLDLSAKLEDENYSGKMEGDLELTKCSFGGTNLNRLEEATFEFNMEYLSDTLQIKSLELKTDGTNLTVNGKVAFSQNIFADLSLESKGLETGKLLKFLPDELLNEYGIENLDGILLLAGTIKGDVADSIMPALDFEIDFKNGLLKTKDYPTLQKLSCQGKITNGNKRNNTTSSAIFNSFHVETETGVADFTLSLQNFDQPKYEVKSKLKLNMEEFKAFIPDSLLQNISGELAGVLSTKGEWPGSVNDDFINRAVNNTSANIDFSSLQMEMDSIILKDFSGSLVYKPGQLGVNNLKGSVPAFQVQLNNSTFDAEFTGEVTQPQNLEILLKSFRAEALQGSIWGSGQIENLKNPRFILDAGANLDLSELKPFIPDSLLQNISGTLEAQITSKGKLNLDSISDQINDIVFNQSKIALNAKNISLTMPDTIRKISNLSGEVKMDKGTISISKVSGIAAGIDFSIDSALISNVYNTVIKNRHEKIFAQGNFTLGAVDYSVLAPFYPLDTTAIENNLVVQQEEKVDKLKAGESSELNNERNYTFELKGKFAAKSFKYNKILLEDISAKFNLTDSVYIVDQFKSNAFEGSTINSIRYSLTGRGKQIINVKNHVERMDIHKFLFAFDNFGYDTLISYENVTGLFSGDLNSRFVFDADTLVTSDMRVMGNLALENGRIINYQPAMEVSKFTGIKELDNIELKTLKCDIFLFKNHMYIPVTDIVSSSMDFSTFGMQSLSDEYEYHLQLKLGEILKGKSKKLFERQKNNDDENGETDVDKNTIKLIYAYQDGKTKMGFDTKKAQRAMARKINVQQKMLELIFHPTLVSFETGVK